MSSDEKNGGHAEGAEEGKFARVFQKWIDHFPQDVELYVEVLKGAQTPVQLKKWAATGLSYLVRQIDFVPDYYQPIGLIDDCIVLRVIADLGAEYTAEIDPEHMRDMFKLANDCDLLREYFGDLYRPLENAIRVMEEQEVHHRTPESIVENEQVQKHFLQDVEDEMKGYKAVAIKDKARAERELLSYFRAKLGGKK